MTNFIPLWLTRIQQLDPSCYISMFVSFLKDVPFQCEYCIRWKNFYINININIITSVWVWRINMMCRWREREGGGGGGGNKRKKERGERKKKKKKKKNIYIYIYIYIYFFFSPSNSTASVKSSLQAADLIFFFLFHLNQALHWFIESYSANYPIIIEGKGFSPDP